MKTVQFIFYQQMDGRHNGKTHIWNKYKFLLAQ